MHISYIYIYYYIVLSAYLCSVFRQAFQDYPIKFVQQITVPLCHHVHVLNGPVVTCSKYKSDEWSSFPCSMSFHVLPWIHVLLVFIEILHVHTCPASIDIQHVLRFKPWFPGFEHTGSVQLGKLQIDSDVNSVNQTKLIGSPPMYSRICKKWMYV